MEMISVVTVDAWWCGDYGSGSEKWETKVTITIRDVPLHANKKESIESLLSCFCDVQTNSYDPIENIHCVYGYAESVDKIPKNGHLKLKYKIENGVVLKSFVVSFEGHMYNEALSKVNGEDDEYDGVDRDLLIELWQE
uniref:Uncharacterized protein n=1 Tax=Oryza punctata TaxID=4537 RepID=A0A0E0LYX8_ORYPU